MPGSRELSVSVERSWSVGVSSLFGQPSYPTILLEPLQSEGVSLKNETWPAVKA